jgi:hypothetical protein
VDYRRNSSNIVVARRFRSELKPKLPTHWQLDPYFDRYSGNTSHIAVAWGDINIIIAKPGERSPARSWLMLPPRYLYPVTTERHANVRRSVLDIC